jgi:ABC-type phosphate transport system substrate-binding protein
MFTVRKPMAGIRSSRTVTGSQYQVWFTAGAAGVRPYRPRSEKGIEPAVIRRSKQRVLVPLALAGAVTCAIIFAGSGTAAPPSSGVACATDGKVDARGATFQTKAQLGFAAGYASDVCGVVGPDNAKDGVTATSTFSNPNMVLYNQYNSPSGQPNTESGSGFGQKAMSCRTDAFAGSDIPYDNATLALLDSAPGSISINGKTGAAGCSDTVANGGFGSDYAPSYAPNGGTYPNAADQTAKMMSFPVAGASEAVFADLHGICTTVPTTITLTGLQISLLFGGDITNWSDARLSGAGGGLGTAACTGAVTRVVRLDKSGTTQIFKNYLKNVDGSRSSGACDTASTWLNLALDAGNTTWPGQAPGTPNCSPLLRGDVNGNPGVLHRVLGLSGGLAATPGAIGYADIADFRGYTPVDSPSLANVRNAANTSFQAPTSGNLANCSFSTMTVPGGTGGAVGLNFDPANPTSGANDTWSLNNPGTIHADVTNQGTRYPICGVTFGLVYSGLSAGSNSAVSQLNADQRRTVYGYFTYILSSVGQAGLGGTGSGRFYSPMATSVVDSLRNAFQSNY